MMSLPQGSFGNQTAVISPAFCAPHPFQLSIKKKVYFSGHGFDVTDPTNGRLLFKVKAVNSFFSSKMIIFDAAWNTIVTLRPKMNSRRSRWRVFRGESKAETDVIFSARLSKVFQFHTNLDVFLGNNTAESVCDFKMKTSYSAKTCDIYGPSSYLIAQMKKKITAGSIFLGKDHFMVTVNPNVDYAFIVAVIVILDEIENSSS